MCSSAVTVNLWRRRRKYMIIKIKCNEVRGSSSLSWWVLLVVVFVFWSVMVVMFFPYIGLKHKIGFCCFTKFFPFTKLQLIHLSELIHLSLYIILEAKVPLSDILLYSASSPVSYSSLQVLLRPSESK